MDNPETLGSAANGYPGKLPSPFTFSTGHQEYQWIVRHSILELRRLISERTREYGDSREEDIADHRDVVLANISVQLFACVGAEAALNFWATVRLGTRRLKRFDRLGLETKLCAVARRIAKIELPEDSDVRQAVRRLVATRNDLVHPKAVVGGPDEDVPPSDDPPRLSDAERARDDLRRVIDFIVAHDDDMWSFFL